jgi:hypothetical protein
MWHFDIICNIEWFTKANGTLGSPLLKQLIKCEGLSQPVQLLLYGTSSEVSHLRVVVSAQSKDESDAILDRDVVYWVRLLEVSTVIVTGKTVTAQVLPGTNSFMIIQGEGDESSPAVAMSPIWEPQSPIDPGALAACLANWPKSASAHLFFFSRLMNERLPVDVRWLHGYRLAEWHFQPGTSGLAKDPRWRALLASFESELTQYLRPGQTLHGLFEQIRASAAHAIAEPVPEDERLRSPVPLVQATFSVIEQIAAFILNEQEMNNGLVKLQKPALNPSKSSAGK